MRMLNVITIASAFFSIGFAVGSRLAWGRQQQNIDALQARVMKLVDRIASKN